MVKLSESLDKPVSLHKHFVTFSTVSSLGCQTWCAWFTCRVEREAFEQRLKERDDAKTRKLAEAKLSKEELADMERRKYKDEEEKMDLLPRLR